MRTNQTSPGNSTVKVAGQVFAIATGLTVFSPCEAIEFPNQKHHNKPAKHISSPHDLWNSTVFRIGEQRFIPSLAGLDNDELDFDFDVNCSPINEISFVANIVSIAQNDSKVFIEEVDYLD